MAYLELSAGRAGVQSLIVRKRTFPTISQKRRRNCLVSNMTTVHSKRDSVIIIHVLTLHPNIRIIGNEMRQKY